MTEISGKVLKSPSHIIIANPGAYVSFSKKHCIFELDSINVTTSEINLAGIVKQLVPESIKASEFMAVIFV